MVKLTPIQKRRLSSALNMIVLGFICTQINIAIAGNENDSFHLSGLLDMSASNKGVALDKIEIGLEKERSKRVSARLVFVMENIRADSNSQPRANDTGIIVDEAVLVFNLYPKKKDKADNNQHKLSFGKFSLPFSCGDSAFISDAPTLYESYGLGVKWALKNTHLNMSLYATALGERSEIAKYVVGGKLNYKLVSNWHVQMSLLQALANGDSAISVAVLGRIQSVGLLIESTQFGNENELSHNAEMRYPVASGAVSAAWQKHASNPLASFVLGYELAVDEGVIVKLEASSETTFSEKSFAGIVQLLMSF